MSDIDFNKISSRISNSRDNMKKAMEDLCDATVSFPFAVKISTINDFCLKQLENGMHRVEFTVKIIKKENSHE